MQRKLLFIIIGFLYFSSGHTQIPTPRNDFFITVWKTDIHDTLVADNEICIGGPQTPHTLYWEEVNNPSNNGSQTGHKEGYDIIAFPTPGTYRVAIKLDEPGDMFFSAANVHRDGEGALYAAPQKLLTVEQWGSYPWANDAFFSFHYCINMDISATDIPDLSKVRSLSGFFYKCTSLKGNPSMNNWNTGNVVDMFSMFKEAAAFNAPIGNWNTANVTNMNEMFSGASNFNQPIGDWNTSNVTGMNLMFRSAEKFNQPIGNWNTTNVTDMSNMFLGALVFNQPIGNWNTGNVTNMDGTLALATAFNQPVGNWNTSKVIDMSAVFFGAQQFNQSLANWNLSSATTLENMLSGTNLSCSNYNATLIGWANAGTTPNNLLFGAADLIYSSDSAVTARNTLITTKGWTIDGDSYDATCSDVPLSATFGNLKATRKGGLLQINWTTLDENNNNHFEVEVSRDGKTFAKIGTVASHAPNGNSSTPLEYSFTKEYAAAVTFLSISLGGLLLGSIFPARKKGYKFIVLMVFIIVAGFSACSRNKETVLSPADANLFIRIAQVNNDGAKTYSKTVMMINE